MINRRASRKFKAKKRTESQSYEGFGRKVFYPVKVYDADGNLKQEMSPDELMALPCTTAKPSRKGKLYKNREITHKTLDRTLERKKKAAEDGMSWIAIKGGSNHQGKNS